MPGLHVSGLGFREAGKLFGRTIRMNSKDLELAKEVIMAEKMYKPLVKTSEGKLVSIWAGGGIGTCLEYKEGQITYTLEGGAGIWVCETLEGAQRQDIRNALCRKKETSGTFVVHEVTPLGELFTPEQGNPSVEAGIRYPAVLVGKEVWSSKGSKPLFKVGDRVRGTGGVFEGELCTIEKIEWRGSGYLYAVSCPMRASSGGTFEENLEPAPKPVEEWVDVTGECEVSLWENLGAVLVVIEHKNQHVSLLGLNQAEPTFLARGYDLKKGGTTGLGTQWFKILKKVTR